jgi:hypothetical protein
MGLIGGELGEQEMVAEEWEVVVAEQQQGLGPCWRQVTDTPEISLV